MEYKEIVAVTGESGLFQLVSSKGDGAIVRTLDGETTRFVPSRKHNFTPLESIEVFTTGTNVPLSEVFTAMQEQEGTQAIPEAGSDAADIRGYFRQIFPSLDEERVYMSDMKKMLKWYPQLQAHDLLRFPENEAVEKAPENTEEEAGDKTGGKSADKTGEKSGRPVGTGPEAEAEPAAAKEQKAVVKEAAAKEKAAKTPKSEKPAAKAGKKEAPKKTHSGKG